MKKTQNYNLNLPEKHDVVNIDDLNENTQFIDKELFKKADKSDLDNLDLAGRASTIIIANYDSHENNKKSADIVIKKGENAAKKINDAIQSLKSTGGEVKLMEGNYNLEYGIAVSANGVHLTGIPNATILVQNKNWKGNPYNGSRRHIIDTKSDTDNLKVTISNLHVKGANISNSHGFSCFDSSTVNNCISENSGGDGFYCFDSSTVNNCISKNSGGHGFSCFDSSTVNNCISKNSGGHGFYCPEFSTVNNCINENSGDDGFSCSDSSTVNNCISENSGGDGFFCREFSTVNNCISKNSGGHGFYCQDFFKGICAFNILKGDTLNDRSSAPAIVEYNIIQEG